LFFCYLFLDPPGGMLEQKNSFTLSIKTHPSVGAGSGIRLSATNPKVSQDVLWELFFWGIR